ncbi:MAG TPA: SRPBCC family protein [Chitinophagaceae bacterium]
MKVIKLALISFVFLFLMVTVISLFFPSHVRISKAIQVNATREAAMAQISDPLNWKNWLPGMDTTAVLYVEGKAEGAILNEKTSRFLAITERKPNEVIAEYKGIKQRKVITGWNMLKDSSSNTVTIQWYMDFSLRWYPWEKFSSILFEKQYGPTMEEGLAKLKKQLENN